MIRAYGEGVVKLIAQESKKEHTEVSLSDRPSLVSGREDIVESQ